MAYILFCITSSGQVASLHITLHTHSDTRIFPCSAFTDVDAAVGMMDNEAAWALIIWSRRVFVTNRKLLTSIDHRVWGCVGEGGWWLCWREVSNELLLQQLPKESLYSVFSLSDVNSIKTLLHELYINHSSVLVPLCVSLSRAHVHSRAGRWTGRHSSLARLPGHPVQVLQNWAHALL